MEDKTNLFNLFNSDTLIKQKVYKSKTSFIPIYINEELYEEIFKEKFNQESINKIIDMFSITLDKNKSNNELVGYAYADKQYDPMGISLSGNLGSGRAFFYGKYFNIKGDKTKLATSPKEQCSNGKFSLSAAIKEGVISNILSKEFNVNTFETLAILDTTDTFDFINEYLSENDTIEEERYRLPGVIEIRINKNKELYRISNAFINNDKFTTKELKKLTNRMALVEADKFIKRFLHGSWSVGNISTEANLIDFDTGSFVVGRCPQYSNTNKYKSNYFGYEYLGSKKIIESLVNNDEIKYHELEKEFDLKYQEYLKNGFCELLGLTKKDYSLYHDLIDELFNRFMKLSRLFLPNYYDLYVYEEDSKNTFVFDFSNFFQNYLAGRKNSDDTLYGVYLLLNKTKAITYDKVGFVKDKVNEFFSDSLTTQNDSYILNEAIEYVKLYNDLFNKISGNLKNIIFKQYMNNMNKKYLYSYEKIFDILSEDYTSGKYNEKTLNIIINCLIKTNINNYSDSKKEYLCDLELYDDYLTYKVVSKKDYYYVLVPYDKYEIRFAKLIINDEEYMFHHLDNSLYSDKIPYNNILEIEKESKMLIRKKRDYYNRYFNYLNYDSELNNTLIKKILNDYYGLVVKRISKINGGSANCFCVYTNDKKYFLKITEQNAPIKAFLLENKILNILKENDINVTTIIKINNDKLALIYDKRLIILEEYMDGFVYHNEPLPKNILLDSAKLLGKLHKILFTKFNGDRFINIWNNFDKKEFERNINYLSSELDDIKDDVNYQYIKDILEYERKNINRCAKYYNMLNDLTFSVSHSDFSKRQLICDKDKIVGIIDFSSCEFVPVVWEIIRSFFLSTQSPNNKIIFDYDLFLDYVGKYLEEFKLNNKDLELMPYVLMYQITVSNFIINEYINGNKNEENIEFLKMKRNICLFLEKEADNISKKLLEKYGNNN